MPLALKDCRKSSVGTNGETQKLSVKIDETRRNSSDKIITNETMDTKKKPDYPISGRNLRKSDADLRDKTPAEPYVHECKDFAGVTIVFRTAPNPKTFDGRGKYNLQDSRRKSEIPQIQSNLQDRFESGEKTDQTDI